eukprot:COSAG02_NODE_16952_length_1040_cov_3.356004_1_plen_186_part_01
MPACCRARAATRIDWTALRQRNETDLTCPSAVDGCIPNSHCTSCHSSCAAQPGLPANSCMSNSSGPVCTDEDCTACPNGFYLLPRMVHRYGNIQPFSELSAAMKVKRSIEEDVNGEGQLPHMQRIYVYGPSLRWPTTGMCKACPGRDTGCESCRIGRKGIGFKSVFMVTECPHICSGGFCWRFDTA